MIVTIDGPVGSGKTTVARELAARLGFTLLDTGAIYRCVALAAQRRCVDWDDEPGVAALAQGLDIRFERHANENRVMLDGEDVSAAVRRPEISQGASRVSALPEVRQALLARQREMAAKGSTVVEGRDTGTVVFPDADAKFFLTADPEIRAERRYLELRQRGDRQKLADVLAALNERDERDSGREVAPLARAPDARLIDSTDKTLEEVIAEIVRYLGNVP